MSQTRRLQEGSGTKPSRGLMTPAPWSQRLLAYDHAHAPLGDGPTASREPTEAAVHRGSVRRRGSDQALPRSGRTTARSLASVTQRARTFKNKARRIRKHNGRAAYDV